MPYDITRDVFRGDQKSDTLNSIGRRMLTVTPSDTEELPEYGRLVCLTAGNATIVPVGNADNDTEPFVGLPAGYVFPVIVRRVMLTGTTATVAVF